MAATGGSTPTAPPPTTQQNRSPSITQVSVNPTFGIAGLQVFSLTAVASDPDNDPLTYSWNVGGTPFSGPTPQFTVPNPGGNFSGTVTVTDGRAGSPTGTVDFIAGSMSGTWRVTTGSLLNMTLLLNQSASGIVTGTWNHPGVGSGNLDPFQPGQINAAGQLTMRLKVQTGSFLDFNMNGSMATTGRQVTGTITGSGFSGQPFVMQKQ